MGANDFIRVPGTLRLPPLVTCLARPFGFYCLFRETNESSVFVLKKPPKENQVHARVIRAEGNDFEIRSVFRRHDPDGRRERFRNNNMRNSRLSPKTDGTHNFPFCGNRHWKTKSLGLSVFVYGFLFLTTTGVRSIWRWTFVRRSITVL